MNTDIYFLPNFVTCPFGRNSEERFYQLYGTDHMEYSIQEHENFYQRVHTGFDTEDCGILERLKDAGYFPLVHVIIGIMRVAVSLFMVIRLSIQKHLIERKYEPLSQQEKVKLMPQYKYRALIETIEMQREEYAYHLLRGVCEIAAGPILWIPDFILKGIEEKNRTEPVLS